MQTRYSIAEARNQLARLVHDAEKGASVELTRRGKPVAVLLSLDQYERAIQGKQSFWDALTAYRKQIDTKELALDASLQDARDDGPGRRFSW
jgi:prevent-host-death family protein